MDFENDATESSVEARSLKRPILIATGIGIGGALLEDASGTIVAFIHHFWLHGIMGYPPEATTSPSSAFLIIPFIMILTFVLVGKWGRKRFLFPALAVFVYLISATAGKYLP